MNPIQQRLIKTDTGTITVVQLLALFIVGTIGVLLGGVAFNWPQFYFDVLVFATCPAALILLMLVVMVTTTLTLREINGESFQLLYLTNIAPSRIVWGFVVGFAYRLRLYIFLLVGAATISAFLISISLRSYGLALEDGDPTVWEAIFLFIFWFNGAIGAAFMTITNAVATTLRFRQMGAAVSAILGTFVIISMGLLTELLLITLADGAAVLFWGLLLAALPYLLGWGLTWLTSGAGYRDILTMPIGVLIVLHWLAGAVASVATRYTIDFLSVILAAYLLLGLGVLLGRFGLRRRIAWAGRLTLISWVIILFFLVWQLASSRSEFVAILLGVVAANALLTLPYAIGFTAVDRATHWVWRF